MNNVPKRVCFSLIACWAFLLFVACDPLQIPPPPHYEGSCFLINGTDKFLHYKAETKISDNVNKKFEISLLPSDTLFIGAIGPYDPYNPNFRSLFQYDDVTIKDEDGKPVFMRTSKDACGETDFVLEESNDDLYNYYLTIDSAYIHEKSCYLYYWEEWY